MKKDFCELGLTPSLVQGLAKTGITKPTTIQTKVIPPVLAGKDLIGQSPTGTGKTLAYLLPLFQKLDTNKRETQAFILAPTHELAIQILRQIELLAEHAGLAVTAAPIIGDVNIMRQIEKLKEKPHIITGSSGRILELVQKKKINSQTVKTIILDEVDRLLDDKNGDSVKAVIKTTQKDRQLLAFSATVPRAALERVTALMNDSVEILLSQDEADSKPDITHIYFVSEQRDKFELLRKIVHTIPIDRALVFINRSDDVELTVDKLKYHSLSAAGIHGRFVKEDRKKAMEGFRSGRLKLLVASDLAARGLDIPGIDFIINLDLPEDPAVYLHRAGRTGRAGKSGIAISLVTPREAALIPHYEKSLRIKIQPKQLAYGKVFDKKAGKKSGVRIK
ncbi:DEAD/DEAH box helicase [Sporomusa acidovorans]|uniref:DEAD-box ATP-dependent RNA helicase CshC n=1 Tax=Sporomusa acidovorans (strain ATCC 49682 / DSM 3132 / Mol) TaxID=1123286 RepID=A0ABZ3J4X6_SPOA4|nr:DEAD/DEAH box helicase [Sporomusa acidovorans]OZC15563.1 DEAD-box ATP-dependent RNA helicase CshA [Sporomusa acidovorans DSM 3132]SDE18409.1 Superfamily II DNA and RNA helicase [Sporomusa acidovorans]